MVKNYCNALLSGKSLVSTVVHNLANIRKVKNHYL